MIDTSLASFERDVIEASMEVPVLLDFWAPWCEPCKALGPLLEKLEREYGGRFRLVNVNSDTNPELVTSFNLKSVPHSVAFVDGNAVAQFMGAQPEAFVRAFLERLIPNPSAIEHRAAREAIAIGHVELAEDYLRNAIALDPSNDAARLDMAALLLDRGEVPAARQEFPQALEQLLEIVRRDRHFRDDGARLKMLSVFEMAAADPDLVTDYRSKLSSLLF